MSSETPHPTSDAPRPIETASATTSPNNSSSGPFAYIVAALALAVCVVLGLAAKGCTTFVGEIVADEARNDHDVFEELMGDEPFLDDFYDDDDYDYDDDDDYDDDWIDHSDRVPLVDLLDEDLALYSSIDVQVGALAYANVRPEVSEAVRALVLVDRNATSEMATLLRTSATDAARASDAVAQAKEQAGTTIATLEATELPRLEGEDADDTSESLVEAKRLTIARWEAIEAELDALAARDRLDVDDIDDLEERVFDTTNEAADAYLEALSSARHL